MSPVYGVVEALPGFDAANNGRVAVVPILAVAVLAGWGLDELTGDDAPSRARRRVLFSLAAGVAVLPVLLVAHRVDLSVLGPAVKVAWGLADPRHALAGRPRSARC